MNQEAYLRFPAVFEDQIVFVSEDDLWTVSRQGGIAHRLTNTPGMKMCPRFSPDGQWIAYSSADEGMLQIFVIPTKGGEARRVTYHPMPCTLVGWNPQGDRIIFRGAVQSPHARQEEIFTIGVDGSNWEPLGLGPSMSACFAPDGEHIVLQRGYPDPATWKRYKGGRCGQLWYGSLRKKNFKSLGKPSVVQALPFLYKDRIYFISDSEGTGNLYSCKTDGKDWKKHTSHEEFYVRWPSNHGKNVVYQMGGEIWGLDLETGKTKKIDIHVPSCSYYTQRRFVPVTQNLHNYALSPKEDRLIVGSRGQLFVAPLWKGAVTTIGKSGIRHKFASWVDNQKIVVVTDESGEEEVVLYDTEKENACKKFGKIGEWGYIQELLPDPTGKYVAVSVASKLYILSLDHGKYTMVDEANHRYFREFSWSPDGKWLAYAKFEGEFNYASIYLYSLESKKITQLTKEEAHDYCPCFDPKGRYLYFLSKRVFNPYGDSLQNDYNFPVTARPYMIVLKASNYSPFSSMANLDKEEEAEKKPEKKEKGKSGKKKGKPEDVKVEIDLEGIQDRIVEIPMKEGRYFGLSAVEDKVLVIHRPLTGELQDHSYFQENTGAENRLLSYDLKDQKEKVLVKKISSFSHAYPYKKMVLRIDNKLRIVKSGEEVKEEDEKPGKEGGWIDLGRFKVMVSPKAEWRQMMREAWRWQLHFYWREDMKGLDWEKVYDKYLPVLDKVRTRLELNDLFWEMYGETGTSHAYVLGGDVPSTPYYRVGTLAVDFEADPKSGRYKIEKIYKGDPSNRLRRSPLSEPGMNVKEGDYLLAVNGQEVKVPHHPYAYLVHLAGSDVSLKISSAPDGKNSREITVNALSSELPVRYHQWVKENREYIGEKTEGMVGYLHIPDMDVAGLVNFHRDFLWQFNKKGLIVDLRYNAGGHVSQVILSKLQRKVLGYCKPRKGDLEAYPYQTLSGPIVALCDEHTGSDGDIFCQAFKDLKLGTLIGKRTWGGVVGIQCDKRLVDGGMLTQPEFAFWFKTQGWDIENRGVEPDIEVDYAPSDYAQGKDPQLERAIAEILKQIERFKEELPKME